MSATRELHTHVLARDELDVVLHPETGDDPTDHMTRAARLATKPALLREVLGR